MLRILRGYRMFSSGDSSEAGVSRQIAVLAFYVVSFVFVASGFAHRCVWSPPPAPALCSQPCRSAYRADSRCACLVVVCCICCCVSLEALRPGSFIRPFTDDCQWERYRCDPPPPFPSHSVSTSVRR